MKFRVIDRETGREPSSELLEGIAKEYGMICKFIDGKVVEVQ